MFGFSSKNPNVIVADFEKTIEKFNRLTDSQRKKTCEYVKEIAKSNNFEDFSLSKESSAYFLKYFEDIVESNNRNERQWRNLGIHEEKLPEIIAFEMIQYYVKAVRYDEKLIALRVIIPRLFAICEAAE